VRNERNERNVFDDLGFSREEAVALTMKAALHRKIVQYAKHYSQTQLRKMLGESQPRISDLMRGKISKFSLEMLVTYADALNMRPEIKTHEPVLMLAAQA
jgi:predicted XRE-type DNA-binding protein